MYTTLNYFRLTLILLLIVISYLAFAPLAHDTAFDTGFDKLNHILAFLVLAHFTGLSFPFKNNIPFIALFLLAYAIFIELVQYFLPHRTFSLLDIIADSIGILLYFLISKKQRNYHLKDIR